MFIISFGYRDIQAGLCCVPAMHATDTHTHTHFAGARRATHTYILIHYSGKQMGELLHSQ